MAGMMAGAQGPAPGASTSAPAAPGAGPGQRGGGRGPAGPRDTSGGQAQQTAGTASISGVVTLEGSVNGVRRAQVSLSGGGRGGRSTMTSDDGRFAFIALPAGRYTLTVSKPGYSSIAYGAKKPGRQGTPIQLANGQALTNVSIALPRGGVITGVVVDEFGEPSPQTQVRAFRSIIQNGERRLVNASSAQTDDRGIYRMFQLLPGEYLVSAVPRNSSIGDAAGRLRAELEMVMQQLQASGELEGLAAGRGRGGRGFGGPVGGLLGGRGQQLLDQAQFLQQQIEQQPDQPTAYAPVYYPGTTTASAASKIVLESGQERSGVDFQLQLVPTAKVSGRVSGVDPTQQPAGNVQVQLQPVKANAVPGLSNYNTRMNPGDGTFQFQNVTPGQYRLMARVPVRAPETAEDAAVQGAQPAGRGRGRGGRGSVITQVLWASTDLAVEGRDLTDVDLMLQPGMTLSGRVMFDSASAAPPDPTTARITLAAVETVAGGGGGPGVMPQPVDAAGNFSISGVVPGRYALRGTIGAAGRGGGGRAGVDGGFGGVRAGGPGGSAQAGTGAWTLKSAVIGGVDVLDFPLEIEPNQNLTGALVTFTTQAQQLAGVLQDAMGRPAPDYTIVLFPADNRYWVPQSRRILSTRPGTDGTFTFRGFPAGQYRLTAVTDAEPGEWYDPAFLTQVLPASMAITIAEGENKTQDIRLATAGN